MLLAAGCASTSPPPGTASPFGVFGDTPYTEAEVERLEQLIDEMNAAPLAFVVHVGDIGSSQLACGDAWLLARKQQFARIRHPFVLLPGDNEWTDCKDPLGRLEGLAQHFCCPAKIRLERQAGRVLRARALGVGWNALRRAQRARAATTTCAIAEYAARAWRGVRLARRIGGAARQRELRLAVLMQANPVHHHAARRLCRAEGAAAAILGASARTIILIHGDTHIYRDDEPIPGVRRIEVWGSPFVSWLRLSF